MHMNTWTKILLALLVLLLIYAAIQYVRTRHYINIGNGLAEVAVKFEQQVDKPSARILTIGDSSVVGTGSTDSSLSVAGRLGAAYPNADIVNLGVNGTRTPELVERFATLEGERFDLIVIHTGGNDIVRFTNLDELETTLRTVLDQATALSNSVVLLHGGNVGTSKLFPAGTRWLFTRRTKRVRKLFMPIAEEKGVYYVDMFREGNTDPFRADPDTFYSEDYFHPSAAGYGDWYSFIEKTIATTSFAR